MKPEREVEVSQVKNKVMNIPGKGESVCKDMKAGGSQAGFKPERKPA